MKAMNLFKAYGRQGLTLDLAMLVEPADLRPLKSIEKDFAAAILAVETNYWLSVSRHGCDVDCDADCEDCGSEPGDVPVQKMRVRNISPRFTYTKYRWTAIQKKTHPRGVVITYPNGDGYPPSWVGKVWKSETHRTFEFELSQARAEYAKYIGYGWDLSLMKRGVEFLEVAERWEAEIHGLVRKMMMRAIDIARAGAPEMMHIIQSGDATEEQLTFHDIAAG